MVYRRFQIVRNKVVHLFSAAKVFSLELLELLFCEQRFWLFVLLGFLGFLIQLIPGLSSRIVADDLCGVTLCCFAACVSKILKVEAHVALPLFLLELLQCTLDGFVFDCSFALGGTHATAQAFGDSLSICADWQHRRSCRRQARCLLPLILLLIHFTVIFNVVSQQLQSSPY